MPADDGSLPITPALRIPRSELTFRASRAGGPGGQHVNRAATRIELWWDVERSPSLTEAQRALLRQRLAHRLDARGRLRLVADARRSQTMNREEAVERFRRVVGAALRIPKPRRSTKPTAASVARRRTQKERRARLKRERRRPVPDE